VNIYKNFKKNSKKIQKKKSKKPRSDTWHATVLTRIHLKKIQKYSIKIKKFKKITK